MQPKRFIHWTAVGLLITALFFLTDWLVAGQPSRFLLAYGLVCAYLWGLGLPLIRQLHEFLLRQQFKSWLQFVIHLIMAVTFGLCHAYLFSLFHQHLMTSFDHAITYQQALRSYGAYIFLPDVMFYGFAVVQYQARLLDQQVQAREMQNAELQKEMITMRLHHLHNQLQPHFLFNTLNGITGLVRSGENKQATEMVVALSGLLRRALKLSDQTVQMLGEELAFVQSYLDIEMMRMGARLKVSMRVPQELQQLLVPVLLLQPLIENAILHGIEPVREGGTLDLEANLNEGHLRICIHNTGKTLVENWQAGVGLGNLRQRLHYLYGSDFALELKAQPDGTLVEVSLPVRSSHQQGKGSSDGG